METKIEQLKSVIQQADTILIGAGAGLSTAAGFTYSGERMHELFGDFEEKYGITDMYAGGFYPFKTLEEFWAWWSRHILHNRYQSAPKPVYKQLLSLVRDKDYFVLTTNVDHQFQLAGFDKRRLFYTQGDMGLFQCSKPCCQETWDNETAIRQMVKQQRDMRIPASLIPKCPNCGRPMTYNLRVDDAFVEDEGWHAASQRYADFVDAHAQDAMLLLELGVGGNTPGIIKYPFWKMAMRNPNATYVCLNMGDVAVPEQLDRQSLAIDADIAEVLEKLTNEEDD